jgi:probable F420-dependent oxidoreductase
MERVSVMKYGVSFPQGQSMFEPGAVRAFAEAVEGLGYDYITMSDHVMGADITNRPDWTLPHTVDKPSREPLIVMGYMAACTQRIMLGTAVVIMPQRQTVLVAKQMTEIDLLSNGRTMLGVGVGRVEIEYQGMNENYHNRGKRLEEQIALLRALWTNKSTTFHGEWHTIEEAGLNTMPIQRPIPIWMGGSSEVAVRRIARLADGWLPSSSKAGEFAAALEQFQGWAREAGRDPSTISVAPRMSLDSAEEDNWVEQAASWASNGATHLGLSTRGKSDKVDDQIDLLRRFSEAAGLAKS